MNGGTNTGHAGIRYRVPVFPSLTDAKRCHFIETNSPVELLEALSTNRTFDIRPGEDIATAKKRVPLFGVGVVRDDLPLGASLADGSALCGVQAVAFDVDHATNEQHADFQKKLAELDLLHLRHPTARYTDAQPRWRYVFPLARIAPAGDYKDKLWGGLNALSGGIGDSSARDATRRSFWPSCPKGQEATRPPAVIAGGHVVDPDELAALVKQPPHNTKADQFTAPEGLLPLPPIDPSAPAGSTFGSSWFEKPLTVADGEGRELSVLKLASHLRVSGMGEDAILAECRRFNTECVKPPLPDDIVVDRVQRYKNPASKSVASNTPQTAATPSDTALAKLFVELQGENFRYDHSCKQWRQYRGGRWAMCSKGEHMEGMKSCAAWLLAAAAKALLGDPDSVNAKKFQALAARAQNAHTIETALRLAQSDPAIAVTADEFDRNPDLFNVSNGVVNLKTGQLMSHDPALMLQQQSPVAYDPDAECPNFLEFMDQISCNDPEWGDYMQRQSGYMLSGHVNEEKSFFWFGDGRNGKSVLANVLRHIMGSYATVAPVGMFMTSRREGGDATPHLASLPGKRLVLANETEAGSKLSAQMLKVCVSTEAIAARALYGNLFQFEPTHKIFMRGNHLPIITECDTGTWRRIDLVPFDLKLSPEQCDHDLERKLLAEESGILRWCIEGHIKWRQHGLTPAARVRNASNTYKANSDVIANWLADECVVAPGAEVEKFIAYGRYRVWAEAEGLRPMSKKSLTRTLLERGFSDGRQSIGARREVFHGFRCA